MGCCKVVLRGFSAVAFPRDTLVFATAVQELCIAGQDAASQGRPH